MLDCWARNLWMLVYAVVGAWPGLDPEQGGNHRVHELKDRILYVLLVALLLIFGLNPWGFVFWLLSPVVVCFFLELGHEEYRGPRVWLSRWYLSILGVVLMLSRLPGWLRWAYVATWVLMSFWSSGFYATERIYYERQKAENRNPDPYRLPNLAFQYLRACQQSIAEDEYSRVLDFDPKNPKAQTMLALLEANREWGRKGFVGMGFN